MAWSEGFAYSRLSPACLFTCCAGVAWHAWKGLDDAFIHLFAAHLSPLFFLASRLALPSLLASGSRSMALGDSKSSCLGSLALGHLSPQRHVCGKCVETRYNHEGCGNDKAHRTQTEGQAEIISKLSPPISRERCPTFEPSREPRVKQISAWAQPLTALQQQIWPKPILPLPQAFYKFKSLASSCKLKTSSAVQFQSRVHWFRAAALETPGHCGHIIWSGFAAKTEQIAIEVSRNEWNKHVTYLFCQQELWTAMWLCVQGLLNANKAALRTPKHLWQRCEDICEDTAWSTLPKCSKIVRTVWNRKQQHNIQNVAV